nr:AMP-binding protein [Burkholderiaceae bacterium]
GTSAAADASVEAGVPDAAMQPVAAREPGAARPAPFGAASSIEQVAYEHFITAGTPLDRWPDVDERSALGVCHTSGTTGNSKGVVYSHRSTVLHAMAMLNVDSIALREADVCLTIVPMFHACGWGFPYASGLAGAAQGVSWRQADPLALVELIERTGATLATAVPTVWIDLLDRLRSGAIDPARLRTLQRLPVGGATVSADLIDGYADFGIRVQHCWGMTEVSPLGLVSTRRSWLSDEQWSRTRLTPGVPLVGCEMRVVSEDGAVDAPGAGASAPSGGAGGPSGGAGGPDAGASGPGADASMPRDGASASRDSARVGELQIRGPWVADAYLDPEAPDGRGGEDRFDVDAAGRRWLKTGDIATIDADGYVRIVDRAKDLIKSGGEWISSLEIESALTRHPAVREAAVVAVADPRWQERPVAYLSLAGNWSGPQPDFAAHLASLLPRWQIPDRFIVLPELPRNATGKLDKRRIRELAGGAG